MLINFPNAVKMACRIERENELRLNIRIFAWRTCYIVAYNVVGSVLRTTCDSLSAKQWNDEKQLHWKTYMSSAVIAPASKPSDHETRGLAYIFTTFQVRIVSPAFRYTCDWRNYWLWMYSEQRLPIEPICHFVASFMMMLVKALFYKTLHLHMSVADCNTICSHYAVKLRLEAQAGGHCKTFNLLLRQLRCWCCCCCYVSCRMNYGARYWRSYRSITDTARFDSLWRRPDAALRGLFIGEPTFNTWIHGRKSSANESLLVHFRARLLVQCSDWTLYVPARNRNNDGRHPTEMAVV